jgi:CBS domain containing-hemolysin-like protein
MSSSFILGLIFLILTLLGVELKKAYLAVPLKELKRRSQLGDHSATKLYRVAAYGGSFKGLLWLYLSLTSAASFVLLTKAFPASLSLLIIAIIIYIIFWLMPGAQVSQVSFGLASLLSSPLHWLLNYLHPLLNRASNELKKHYHASSHTGIFEKEDLLDLLKRQQKQEDSRLTERELGLLKRALTFEDKTLSHALIPANKVKTLLSSDVIGPILINELHENPLQLVLVKEAKKGEVIGSLAFSDLNIHSQGQVEDFMKPGLYYLNENDNLSEAIRAMLATNQSLMVVIDNANEYIGIVTLNSVLEHLLGPQKMTNSEDYLNRDLIAGRYQKLPPQPED